ncbi:MULTISPECIES: type II toxin-antitoxin system RelE/ParE family toxin [unclassified Methylobacterium]|uniref:type II toxin-antitoxin system RelE/ParE family toxin n=1 Tax=unclassified Methylobacterium TaxID=2615210 RepID=UPI001FED8A4A|nr:MULTISPECIES: type II toxin-antitoxin system RelE/ParE family toxin [unclassified Methylobacterium]
MAASPGARLPPPGTCRPGRDLALRVRAVVTGPSRSLPSGDRGRGRRTCHRREGRLHRRDPRRLFRYAVGSHVIVYRQTGAGIDVIRILHRRMDVPSGLS